MTSKLTKAYEKQIAQLKARIRDLEEQLKHGPFPEELEALKKDKEAWTKACDRIEGLCLKIMEDYSPFCLAFDSIYRQDKYEVIAGHLARAIRKMLLGEK